MNILAYLVTVMNLQNLPRNSEPLQDISLHIDSLNELTELLKNLPDFPLDGYRNNGVQRHGKMAVYASQNLRDFLYEGRGMPYDEGVVMKLHYSDNKLDIDNYDTLSYVIHGKDMNDHVKKAVSKYVESRGRRNKRSFVEKLGP